MLTKEVDYRLAKWVLPNMEADDIIKADEMRLAWRNMAGRFNPPFLDVENLEGNIGDWVIVDGK